MTLEPEQEELLCTLVEAARNTPREYRRSFMVVRNLQGDYLVHPGVPEGKRAIHYGDVEILELQGLVHIRFGSRGTPNIDVTPQGFRYYEDLKVRQGRPVERVEKTMHNYIDGEGFRYHYPNAYSKWSQAEALLWKSDGEEQFTTIGHLCREAFQEFTDVLASRFDLHEQLPDKAKTIGRLRAVIERQGERVNSTYYSYLLSLIDWWSGANDLIQRQEHGGQKEGEQLRWEDARRVVFATLIVMYEVHKSLRV